MPFDARKTRSFWLLLAAATLNGCAGDASSAGTAGQSGAHLDGGALLPGASRGGGGSSATGEGTGCATPGMTRSCCDKGTQTCNGVVEFAIWGPCTAPKGVTLQCGFDQPHGCGIGEFALNCDAGMSLDSGHSCADNEFAPGCSDGGTPRLCNDKNINNEPEILGGYAPASGQSVGRNGQIKLWVTDEHAPFIAPNEQLDPNTGMVITPGDRTAKASDGYLLEPALYIAPQTAENGGTPHFPQLIKGAYNNKPLAAGKRMVIQGAPIDPPPAGVMLTEKYSGEDVWDVSALGLSPGTYSAEFLIHDGDEDRGVGCVTIIIAP
jgi:hypothetical protein